MDAESGLVHAFAGTSGNINEVAQTISLLHVEERTVFADSGYRGAHKRPEAKPGVTWQIAEQASDRKRLKASAELGEILVQIEKLKSSIRTKVEHPVHIIKRQFGHTKVRYRGLFKNIAQLKALYEPVRPMGANVA